MKDFKSATEPKTTFPKNNSYIVNLERFMKDLLQYDGLLNSYICEPQTKELFEKKDALKFQLKSLEKTNSEIINAIRKNKENGELQIDRINKQFEMLEKLQVDLKAYSNAIMDNSKMVS